jgi:transposase-like protein
MTPTGRIQDRPPGYSSRLHRARGPRRTWVAPNGQALELPVIVDHVNVDPKTGNFIWHIEARVDLVGRHPNLVDIRLIGNPCLDTVLLQRFFRWATPVEVVRRTVPALLEKGIDPFKHEYATDGYPDAADIDRKTTNALSDAFLEEVARQYVEIGRGYARVIARQRGVSERTVVSWVQKARRRNILSPTTPGRRSEEIVPAENRKRADGRIKRKRRRRV